MKQTRIQRSTKPIAADDAGVHPQDTPTRRTIHLTKVYANTFSLQSFSPLKHNALISILQFLLTGGIVRYKHLCIRHTHTMHHNEFSISAVAEIPPDKLFLKC